VVILKIQTKYFGQVEYDEEDVLHFPNGLFGFEEEREFLLLPFADSGGNMLSLQSVHTQGLAFVVLNPLSLCSDYDPALPEEELKALEVAHSYDLGYYVLCVVKHPVSQSTVNLQCPVAINPKTRQARQVILEDDRYEMRHPLQEFSHGAGEGEAAC
jgi:flagellar assembly factor FliW